MVLRSPKVTDCPKDTSTCPKKATFFASTVQGGGVQSFSIICFRQEHQSQLPERHVTEWIKLRESWRGQWALLCLKKHRQILRLFCDNRAAFSDHVDAGKSLYVKLDSRQRMEMMVQLKLEAGLTKRQINTIRASLDSHGVKLLSCDYGQTAATMNARAVLIWANGSNHER